MPFELRPDMPEEGWQMSELEAGGHSDRVEQHLYRVAERDGFPMMVPGFLPKTHLALSLGEFARDRGESSHIAVHHAIFGAYFGKGLDIGSRDVLLQIAEEEGLAAEEVGKMWQEGAYDERLKQFRHVAIHMGLDSTPAALICDELHIGSRPYQVFRDSVDHCLDGAEEEPNVETGAGAAGEGHSPEGRPEL